MVRMHVNRQHTEVQNTHQPYPCTYVHVCTSHTLARAAGTCEDGPSQMRWKGLWAAVHQDRHSNAAHAGRSTVQPAGSSSSKQSQLQVLVLAHRHAYLCTGARPTATVAAEELCRPFQRQASGPPPHTRGEGGGRWERRSVVDGEGAVVWRGAVGPLGLADLPQVPVQLDCVRQRLPGRVLQTL